MNRREAAEVLAVLQILPYGQLDAVKVEVWFEAALASCPAEVGVEVARYLVKTCTEFPTPAEFNAHVRRVERGRQTPHRALPAAESDKERALEHIAALREQLKKPA